MAQITSIEKQRGLGQRHSIFVDDQFLVGLSAKVVRDLHLVAGLPVDPALHRELLRQAVRESAIMSLARREHSRREITTKLKQKKFPAEVISTVCDELEESNFLNDRRFAGLWVENRTRFHPRGRRGLALELDQKGISPELATEVLAEQFGEEIEIKVLIDLIAGRLRRQSSTDPQVFKRRLLGFLARRGFAYGDIRRVLNEHFPEL